MLATTGLISLVLLFVAGPYLILEKRWPRVWPPLPVWAHANVSLAAVAVVLLHVALKSNKFGLGLPWVATGLLVLVTLSGLYGMQVASIGGRRQSWLRFQRWLVYVFYAVIAWHIVTESIGFALIAVVVGGWVMWHWRALIRRRLIRLNWPYSQRNTIGRSAISNWRFVFAWQTIAILLVTAVSIGGAVTASTLKSSDGYEARGHIVEINGGRFTFEVNDAWYTVATTEKTKFEHFDGDLQSILDDGTRIKVEGHVDRNGIIVAREIELK
jgi:hypothetical protein